jgi:hypothetical protein
VPFRWTVNPYRGCTHACTYCLDGPTPVLMADGSTKPISDLKVGDRIYGTERIGVKRRYVITEVLDHWATVRPAYRLTLNDGTKIVGSADHRFLTRRGWKQITGNEPGGRKRRLSSSDQLLGPGPPDGSAGDEGLVGDEVGTCHALWVSWIEPLQQERTLFDVTTGTGDFVAAGAVTHNCFARPTHKYLDLSPGRDFDSALLKELAERVGFTASLSVPTLDEKAWRTTEPHTPHPRARLEAVGELNRSGVPTGILIAPLMPGVNDSPAQVERILELASENGATGAAGICLHLRGEVKGIFMDWLRSHRPDLVPLYEELYARGAYASKEERRRISKLVRYAGSPFRRGQGPKATNAAQVQAPEQPTLF